MMVNMMINHETQVVVVVVAAVVGDFTPMI
jgi:hypothetical protein